MAKPTLILAIETSSPCASVALANGEALLGERRLGADQRLTTELLPTIKDLLDSVGRRLLDVTLLAYSHGPGSFTGLRVAATTARMTQSAVGCDVVAVPTLEAIARNALSLAGTPTRLAAILDARRGQVFGALYERTGEDELREIEPPALRDPHVWLASIPQPFAIIGEGAAKHEDACRASGGSITPTDSWTPSAVEVLAIGRRMAAEGRLCGPNDITPLYLRPPACEEVYEQKRAAARARRGE